MSNNSEVLIHWNHAFDLGVEQLDQDHQNLVELINQLDQLVKTNAPHSDILQLLEQTERDLITHFTHENEYIRKAQSGKEAENHLKFHDVTLEYLAKIILQFREDPESISAKDLLNYLHGWIIDHIINQDHKMRDDLERKGIIQSDLAEESAIARFLDNFRLRSRIAALALFPLIALLFFAGDAVLEKRATVAEMEKIEQLSTMAGTFSTLVHELQKERGASAGFLASKGMLFGDKVIAQRKNTDEKNQPVPDALKLGETLGLKAEIAAIKELLNKLPEMRKKVSAQEITVAQEVGYYSALNSSLLNSIAAMSKISNDLGMSNRISTFVNFLQSKERAGIERAKGSAGYGTNIFSPALLKDFVSLIAIQDTYMNVAKSFATPKTLAYMAETISGKAISDVDEMRKIAIASPTTKDLKGITGPQWFDTITKKINLLKKTENYMAKTLKDTAKKVRLSAQTAFMSLLTITIIISGLIIAFAIILINSVVKPLRSLRHSIERLEQGHTETMIAGRHKSDELGEMARAIQSFKETIIRQNMEQAKQGIEQSVRERTSVRRLNITQTFKDVVANAISKMAGAAGELEHHAEAMSGATETSRSQSSMVASAATQATSNVETVAAAAEELSSSIQEISRQVEHSSTIATSATTSAEDAQQTILGLADGANKIGQVVQMITDIAEQTNLLALNATIEAARAGEAGKGFAVVASEVKNLANQTAKATEDITAQINTIQSDTQRAVDAIAGVSRTIDEMAEVTTSVSAAVDQQGSATQEISTNVNEAATGTRDVSNNIEGVAQANEETGRMSNEVFTSAKQVADNADELQNTINNYLKDMTSA
ncbi:putative Methyl-accepting chemotaxis protein [Candidatus Terasakiella magnetica]|uniref:Putative Methyl-accepting chemotaxis protein n=1 Tax=Candidatus Terasakiella magnetica TaxID=1867952 RepID=A0A1C3RLM3_9PROT|nr:nitrate- and nitrite sensing domain-containing protein [Candidatus Terasakiella magnetica]SCA58210.1 putative Methyl-accepting chemotaxis protein [Candidatus Terasakiella magnetica]